MGNETKYICIIRYKGNWSCISNYGWNKLAECYVSICKEAHDVLSWSRKIKDPHNYTFQVCNVNTMISRREFTYIEAIGLYFVLYKNALGDYPEKLSKSNVYFQRMNISPQKLLAIGKKCFNEVSWKGVKVWGYKIQ